MKPGKPNKKKEKVFKEGHVLVMLEKMQDDIKLIAEGQVGIDGKLERIDERFDRIDEQFEQNRNEHAGMLEQFEQNRNEHAGMLEQLERNNNEHGNIMEYLSRIEDEILEVKRNIKNMEGGSMNKKEYSFIRKRVDVLERQVEKFGVLLKVKNV